MPRRLLIRCALSLCLALGTAHAQKLSPLAPKPNWTALEAFQETITREEFTRLLDDVYAPKGAAKECIEVQANSAVVKTTLTPPATWTLRFATEAKTPPRTWRTPAQLGPAPDGQPLAGAKIALDPGHLGGPWAKMEQRFFQVGESRPVTEGDLTLRVAQLIAPQLRALGAEVLMVRATTDPVTTLRPETLHEAARAEIGPTLPDTAVRDESELLFYRTSEIRQRAQLVNERLRPDLTVCLHFNAEAWGDPRKPEFVPRNHLHVLLNGSYGLEELRHDDMRFDMLRRLLSRAYPEELAAATTTAAALAQATKLPAYEYTTPNATRVSADSYLWARNLLANRLYQSPVIFLEPYVMNSELVWERVQAGDYEGEILLGGEPRRSIFREYADAVVAGVREYYTQGRPKP